MESIIEKVVKSDRLAQKILDEAVSVREKEKERAVNAAADFKADCKKKRRENIERLHSEGEKRLNDCRSKTEASLAADIKNLEEFYGKKKDEWLNRIIGRTLSLTGDVNP